MIDRNSPEYQKAKWRVKIGHAFLEKGLDIKGVIHVGANDGYEVEYYLKLGIENILCFEPLKTAFKKLEEKYHHHSKVKAYNYGLGEFSYTEKLIVADGDGQDSSFLNLLDNKHKPDNKQRQSSFVWPFTHCVWIWGENVMSLYDCLVIDVQGMELMVLKGFGNYLDEIDMISVECSRKPIYENGVPASEVIKFLVNKGFKQDSPIEDHNDIFFVRK